MSDTVETATETAVLPDELMAAIEAVLMVAERPIEPRLLAQLVDTGMENVEAACAALDQQYRDSGLSLIHI